MPPMPRERAEIGLTRTSPIRVRAGRMFAADAAAPTLRGAPICKGLGRLNPASPGPFDLHSY